MADNIEESLNDIAAALEKIAASLDQASTSLNTLARWVEKHWDFIEVET